MPFQLKRLEAGVWSGKAGQKFEVDVAPSGAGGPFLIHSVCYAGKCVTAAPFRFDVAPGEKALTAVYDWDAEDSWVELRERDDTRAQVLRKRRYREAEPFQSILIRSES